MFCSHVKTFKFMAGPRSPTFLVTAQLVLRCWRIISFWRYAGIQQRTNERMVVLPQTRCRSFHGVENLSHLDGMKRFKNMELMAVPSYSKHDPVLFTVLKNHFVWMLCSQFNTFKLMAGPRSPTSSVTAQFISRRPRIVSFWCCADFQKRSNQRMVVLPQARCSSIQSVEKLLRLDGMKLLKNIRTYGWAVFPQTGLCSIHGVEELFRQDVMQPCKNFKVYGWAALHNIPCHSPTSLAALKNRFVLMLCRLLTTFKQTTGCAPPNTVQLDSPCWKTFSFGMFFFFFFSFLFYVFFFFSFLFFVWSLSTTFKSLAKPWSPKHGPVLFTVLKYRFFWLLCSHLNTFKFMAGPRSP